MDGDGPPLRSRPAPTEVVTPPRSPPPGRKAREETLGLEQYLATCSLERKLLDLVRLRVSQMNGCAYCLDMHWKDLVVQGETEQRMYSLDAWGDTPYYTERERAALAWAEAVTRVADGHVPDAVHEEARRHFGEQELADLTLAIVAINGWNRLNIAFRTVPGTYEPPRAPRPDGHPSAAAAHASSATAAPPAGAGPGRPVPHGR